MLWKETGGNRHRKKMKSLFIRQQEHGSHCFGNKGMVRTVRDPVRWAPEKPKDRGVCVCYAGEDRTPKQTKPSQSCCLSEM